MKAAAASQQHVIASEPRKDRPLSIVLRVTHDTDSMKENKTTEGTYERPPPPGAPSGGEWISEPCVVNDRSIKNCIFAFFVCCMCFTVCEQKQVYVVDGKKYDLEGQLLD